MFARCWLLVEGETEFWLLPELARVLGYDFGVEGIVPVEFAQCGLPPLVKLAESLGISWQVLADGDDAGDHYMATAEQAAKSRRQRRVRAGAIQLAERDIEACFWYNGFDDVIRRIAYPGSKGGTTAPEATIKRAIERSSKPFLALSLIEAAAGRGAGSVPAALRHVIERCVQLARSEPGGRA
jgi:putative ATP-dependent endonuclease of OLD family